MQIKATPLRRNEETGVYEPAQNVAHLNEGRTRIRVMFLPDNELQHEMVAEFLPTMQATIVQVSADPLLKITREDEVARLQPGQTPKVHVIGSPLFMDIEIGPAQLSAETADAAEAPQPAAEAASAGPDTPAANTAPAPPTDANTAPPAMSSQGPMEDYVDEPDKPEPRRRRKTQKPN